MDYVARRMARALKAWVGTQDVLGEYPLVTLTVAVGGGEGESEVVQAYESPPSALTKLLEQDAAASVGPNPDAGDAYDALVYHSLRLRHLMASGTGLADDRNAAVGRTAAEVLVSISEVVRELAVVIGDVRAPVMKWLDAGRLQPAAPIEALEARRRLHLPLSAIDELIDDLLGMATVAASLKEVEPDLTEGRPALAPSAEFVLQAPLSGRHAIGRYHVRIFRSPTRHTRVVLGQLRDNGARSVINGVELLARLVAELELNTEELGTVRWVSYEPAPTLDAAGREDSFTIVDFERPEQFEGPSWRYLDPQQLQDEALVGVQRYMARDYNSRTLRRRGIRLVEWNK